LLGLTGIELIGDQDVIIPLENANLHCNIGDTHLTNLIDGHNITIDMDHMWLVDITSNKKITITVIFNTDMYITGMRIWNYNASLELSYCGVRYPMCISFSNANLCICNNQLKEKFVLLGKTATD